MATYNYHTTAPAKQAAEKTLFIYLHITFPYILQSRPFPVLLILNTCGYSSAAVLIFRHLMHHNPLPSSQTKHQSSLAWDVRVFFWTNTINKQTNHFRFLQPHSFITPFRFSNSPADPWLE